MNIESKKTAKSSSGVTISTSRLSKLIEAEAKLKEIEERNAIAPFEQELKDLVFGVLRKTPLEKWPKLVKEAFDSLAESRYVDSAGLYKSRLPTYAIPNDIRRDKSST